MRQPAPETLEALYYRGAEQYEAERRGVFARAWLLAAHESQFAGPGAYVAMTTAGFPLILVRGEDAVIRAFHNVCRHRAGPLADNGAGNCAGALVCRYHGWRYALDGRLANARDFGPAEGFDPRDYSLFPVRCEIWRGFVFVNMDRDAEPLARATSLFDERLHDWPVETFRFARHTTHEIRCNWKTYVENYLEGYHVPSVHPGLNAAIDAAKYEVDIQAPAMFYSAPARDGSPVSGIWAWLWPCLGINIYANGVMMERMWPIDHARTRLDYLYFFPADLAEAEIARAMASSEATTVEDIAITEAVQRNLDAGVYAKGRLSPKHETGVGWFQSELRRATGN
jgi:choline monooxygenase